MRDSQSPSPVPTRFYQDGRFLLLLGFVGSFALPSSIQFALAQLSSTRSRYLTNPCTPPALSRLALTLGSDTHFSERQRQKRATNSVPGFHCSPIVYPGTFDSLRDSLRGAVTFFFLLNHLHLGLDNTDRT